MAKIPVMLQKNEQWSETKVPRQGNLGHEAQHRSGERHAGASRRETVPIYQRRGEAALLPPCFLRGGQLRAVVYTAGPSTVHPTETHKGKVMQVQVCSLQQRL